MSTSRLRYGLSLGLVLFGAWLLWSGHYTGLLIGLGVVSCCGVVLMAARMGVLDDESTPIGHTLGAVRYAPWLTWQIVRANVDVARRILHPRLPIAPRVVRVTAGQRTDVGRVIFANSITLTPGTVSLSLDGETVTVHALTREAADELLAGEMDRRVRAIEGAD